MTAILLPKQIARSRKSLGFSVMLWRDVEAFWIPSEHRVWCRAFNHEMKRRCTRDAQFIGRYVTPVDLDRFEEDLRAHLRSSVTT